MRSLYFLFFLSFLYHQRVHSVIFNCSNDTSFELMKDSSLDTEFTTTFQFNYFTTAPGFSIEIRLSKSASFDGSTVKGIYFSAIVLDNNDNPTSMNFGNFPVFNPQIFSDDTYPCFTGSFQNNLIAFWRPGTMPYPDKFRLCVGVTTSESPPSGYVECQDIRMAQAVTKPTIVAGMGMWNGKIDLKCMVSVFPRPEFKWYYNGMEVVENEHYTLLDVSSSYLSDDDYQHILGVQDARTYDALFNYRCTVTNILQVTEISSDLSTLSISDLPISLLNSPDDNVNKRLGESVVVNCTFGSYPSPLIIWKKNGSRIFNTSRICIIPGMEREDPDHGIVVYSRLAFSSLEHSDEDTYTCEAMRGGNMPLTMIETFMLNIIVVPNINFITADTIAVVNTYVSLLCQADGVPSPTITWYNSNNMAIGTTASISVRVLNDGLNTWTCVAENSGGIESSTVSITGYRMAANITSPPRDTTVDYRERASFVCIVVGNPIPVVNWYFTHYSGTTEVMLTVNNTIYTVSDSMLLIQKTTLAEQGSYCCEAINIATSVKTCANLTVQQIRPSVQIRPVSKEVIYNSVLPISCIAAGMPAPTQSIILPNGNKVPSPYTITLFNENDVGTYSCVATSPLNGEVAVESATYTLTVLNVEVTPSTASVEKTSTNDLVFTCDVTGSPTFSTLKWYHQNLCSDKLTEIMNADQGYVITSNTLTITPNTVTRFLPGLYICFVERFSSNYSGSASLSLISGNTVDVSLSADYDCPDLTSQQQRSLMCSATSTSNPITYSWFQDRDEFNPASNTVNLNSRGYGNYRCVATVEQVCNFTESAIEGGLSVSISPSIITVMVGKGFTIQCNAEGFPTLTYTWYKNGVIIINQNLPTYTIIAATTADNGTYTCDVRLAACGTNILSSGSTVNVMEVPPSISTTQQDVNIVLSTDKTITCNANGIPQPNIQWYKDQVPIINEISSTYTISTASAENTGLYACEAFSYVSRSFQDISNLIVYQIPHNIRISGAPEDPVNIGQEISLICMATGVPQVEYEWIDSSGNIIENMGALTVTIEGDSSYKCIARNDWGTVMDMVTILIKIDVVIPQSLDTNLIVIPSVFGGLFVGLLPLMVCLICLMIVLNSKRIKRSRKGVVAAGDSNVLLSDQLVHNSAHVPDETHSLPSEGDEDSIKDITEIKLTEISGGLDKSNPLTAAKLMELVTKVEATGGSEGDNELCREFESIPSNMAKWTTMPKDSEIKNRYMNVLPNESTMVELSFTGETGSTFINANYIADFTLSKKSAYIATQGPLPSTIADFWRMVWENDVSAVVMTCNLVERKRIRCSRYWPDTNQRPTEIYGTYKVSIDSFAKTEDYEICILYLTNLKAQPDEIQKKQVYHYWYKSWPSFGVPKETSKIWKFLKEIHTNAGDTRKPFLFHCSAGIGRTAVFIGIDMGMLEYKSHTKVDPLKYLCTLRKGRGGSIQTSEQYLYMHRVLQDFIMAQTDK